MADWMRWPPRSRPGASAWGGGAERPPGRRRPGPQRSRGRASWNVSSLGSEPSGGGEVEVFGLVVGRLGDHVAEVETQGAPRRFPEYTDTRRTLHSEGA